MHRDHRPAGEGVALIRAGFDVNGVKESVKAPLGDCGLGNRHAALLP